MKKSILVSAMLAGALVSSSNALDLKLFGDAGVMGLFQFGNNTINNTSLSGYVGVVGHLGLDLDFSGFKLGVGAIAGYAPLTVGTHGTFTNNEFVGSGKIFPKPWVDLSDLYAGYVTDGLKIKLGRYNGSEILQTADWIGGYNQGIAFSYGSDSFGVWATYVNEVLRNGFNASHKIGAESRYGFDISRLGRYSNYFDFNFNNELFAGGVDVKIGDMFMISPFVQYWLRNGNDVLQVGGRAIADLDLGGVKSTTTARVLWSKIFNEGSGFMWQVDQEFLFLDMIKLGGGYLSIGGISLNGLSLVDRTRFYGQYLHPASVADGTGLSYRSYLGAGVGTWYLFTGAKLGDSLDLDILYAGGDYREFSAIASYTIIGGGDSDGFKWSVGGGYVNNGFRGDHAALAFTKISF